MRVRHAGNIIPIKIFFILTDGLKLDQELRINDLNGIWQQGDKHSANAIHRIEAFHPAILPDMRHPHVAIF